MSELALYQSDEQERAYHLRLAGMSFRQISAELAITTARAVELYRSHVVEAAKIFGGEDRRAVIQTELDRLDALQQPHWVDAMSGDGAATDRVLRIMAHRMKLLGLDQLSGADKTQIAQVLVVGGSREEFINALNNGRMAKTLTGSASEDGVDLY